LAKNAGGKSMKKSIFNISKMVLIALLSVSLVSCTSFQKARKRPKKCAEIVKELQREIARLQAELDEALKYKEGMETAKQYLEEKLREEIARGKLAVEMQGRGLVVTVVAEVLFDSGKAIIKPEAEDILDKVVNVLKNKIPDKSLLVEGHTDNDPIKHSGWKSNWELSTARATSVVHYFVDKGSLDPSRLSAAGCGEYRPVVSNDTEEGKAENRRVELVILPDSFSKEKVDLF